MSQVWRSLLVNAKAVEAERITSFELVDPEGKPLTPFSAGSHIDVEIKQGLVRQYSLCNDPRNFVPLFDRRPFGAKFAGRKPSAH